MTLRTVFLLPTLLLAGPVLAQNAVQTSVRPAGYVFGTSEHGSGSAYDPPNDAFRRDDAVSVGLGLDASRVTSGGRIDASIFALAHDPLSEADRGFLVAGRIRASFGGGPWTLRIEDAPRIQHRDAVGLSNFERNELSLEVEHRALGPGLGVRVVDRRRSVSNDEDQGFDRQSIVAFVAGTTDRGAWRLEAGPQRYGTTTGNGWRLVGAADLLRTFGRLTAALRFAWTEPLEEPSGQQRIGDLSPTAVPTPAPVPTPSPVANVPPYGTLDTSVPPDPCPISAPSLLGPGLVVDALDADDGDWDFGRRKQALVVIVSHRLTDGLLLSFEANLQRERGEELLAPWTHVSRDRAAARLSLRRSLGTKVALVVQGGVRRIRDERPSSSYTWGIASVGLELRP